MASEPINLSLHSFPICQFDVKILDVSARDAVKKVKRFGTRPNVPLLRDVLIFVPTMASGQYCCKTDSSLEPNK